MEEVDEMEEVPINPEIIFDNIFNNYGYTTDNFTKDELYYIKYKIYGIFFYIPDKDNKKRIIDEIAIQNNSNFSKFEETYMKTIIKKIYNSPLKSNIDLLKNIETVLYNVSNKTEENDESLAGFTQKNTEDVHNHLTEYLKLNYDNTTEISIQYDKKCFVDYNIKYISNTTNFKKIKEEYFINFIKYIYAIDKDTDDKYLKWFMNHINVFINKSTFKQNWYDINGGFYIKPDNTNHSIKKFINAISVFEFSILLLSRYHITTKGKNKGWLKSDKSNIKLETVTSVTNALSDNMSEDKDDSTKDIYGFKETKFNFLADKAQNLKGKRNFKKKDKASLKIYDEYLQRKVIVANSPIDKDKISTYDNVLKHFLLKPINNTKITLGDSITTYNINQKNIIEYLGKDDINLLIKKNVLINFFQEVNLKDDMNPIQYLTIKNTNFDKKIKANILKTNVMKFITDNKILIKKSTDEQLSFKKKEDKEYLKNIRNIDNWYLSIPLYNLVIGAFNKSGFFITNRLASFDKEDKVQKHNGMTFNKPNVNLDEIKIGKLGLSLDDHRTHIFIAIPSFDNNTLYIDIHLDTNDSDRKKQLELIFLLNKIIPSKAYNTYKKIIIAGDFNMDVFEIVKCITRVKNIHYKDKRFLILNNNIITKAGNTLVPKATKKTIISNTEERKKYLYDSLDNCLIIETTGANELETKILKDEYKPKIFVNNNTNGEAQTSRSDHSLMLFELSNPVLINTSVKIQPFDSKRTNDFRISNSASNSISIEKERLLAKAKMLSKELKEKELLLNTERSESKRLIEGNNLEKELLLRKANILSKELKELKEKEKEKESKKLDDTIEELRIKINEKLNKRPRPNT